MGLADIQAFAYGVPTFLWTRVFKIWAAIRFPWVKIGSGFKTQGGMPFLYASTGGSIVMGRDVSVVNSTRYNGLGIVKRSSFVAARGGSLVIGDRAGFSGVSIYCANHIEIGSHVMVGGNTCIWDTDFHALDYAERKKEIEGLGHSLPATAPIVIGEGVFIGANCIILKGVTIGRESIIGAGSVVTKSVPDREIWGGNPATFIRKV